MFCHNCGKEISDGATFCAGCGIKIAKPNTLEKKKTLLKKLFTKAENVATKPIGRVEKQRKRKKWVIGIGLAALLCILICVFVPKAMVKIGRYYQDQGYYSDAVYWYTTAANMGNADAQYYLGYCYNWGNGVPKDKVQAVFWYGKAAEQGNADAQFLLGKCYFYGLGVSENRGQAVYWYRLAAQQGEANAQHELIWLGESW